MSCQKLDLPTQDGNWQPSRDVARTEIGVARQHCPIPELRPILQLDDDDRCPEPRRPDRTEAKRDPLRDYFGPWRGRLPHGAAGAHQWLARSPHRLDCASFGTLHGRLTSPLVAGRPRLRRPGSRCPPRTGVPPAVPVWADPWTRRIAACREQHCRGEPDRAPYGSASVVVFRRPAPFPRGRPAAGPSSLGDECGELATVRAFRAPASSPNLSRRWRH